MLTAGHAAEFAADLSKLADALNAVGEPAYLHRFILRNGFLTAGARLPKPYRRSQAKQCFRNAATLVLRHRHLAYVEGFAWRPSLGLPIHHAWAYDGRQVIDPTWRDPDECYYYGIAFDADALTERLRETSTYGVFDPGERSTLPFMLARDPGLGAAAAPALPIPG